MQNIVIINESKSLTSLELAKVVAVCQTQITTHFAPIWGKDANLYISNSPANSGDWKVYIQDALDEPDIEGYHQIGTDKIPYAKVKFGKKWSYTISHELLEMIHNPKVSENSDQKDGNYIMQEVADATNGIGYEIDSIEVSNFVTPNYYDAYYNEKANLKYDYLGKLKRPLELYEGGYISWFTTTGEYYQALKAKGKLIIRKLTGDTTVVDAVLNPWPYIISGFLIVVFLVFKIKRNK
jgi:hypothetical protein